MHYSHNLSSLEKEICSLESYKALNDTLNSVTLHDVQCVDIIKMLYQKKCIVIYPTGKGKTLMAASVFKLLSQKDPNTRFIMFVKKDQLIQTPEKLTRMLGIPVLATAADAKSLRESLYSGAFLDYRLILITHDCLKSQELLQYLFKYRNCFTGLIIDEAHQLSNFGKAASAEMLSAVTKNFQYVFALTATPITTEIKQIAKLAYVVDRDRYNNPTKLTNDLKSGRFSINEDPCFFINRFPKDFGCSTAPVGRLLMVDASYQQKEVSVGGVELMRVCKGENAINQVRALVNVINSHKEKGQRGLVYISQHAIREWVVPFLEKAGINYTCIHGFTKGVERSKIMHKFNDLYEYDVIITSVTTAIDLDCDYVVFYELTVDVDQMIGRADRGLNDKMLLVYFMLTKGTKEIDYFLNNIYQRCVDIDMVDGKGNVAAMSVAEEVGSLC